MNAVLYAVTVLIWGSTWLAIKGQLGDVHPTASIAYRFALAAVILLAWARLRGLPLRYPLRVHGQFVLMGALMFSTNFVCFYFAEQHLTTGLVSIVFAMSLVVNMVFARVFFRRSITAKMLVGGGIGLLGIVTVFWPEFQNFGLSSGSGQGIVLSVLGTLVFCLGNVVSGKTQAAGIPVVQGTGYAMAYGALLMAPFAAFFGHGAPFQPTLKYTGSLLYLAVFGSVVGFGAYLTLLGRIGGERAAYAMVLFPIVSLLLSTVFEHFSWTARDLAGVVLILVGNLVMVANPALLRRLTGRPAPAPEPAAPAPADR
ncbi:MULTISPECIES: DMT family transporter [unclassified Streptomyces]|uniref:DMT family transporter n=1 Tax=unclassified Streptomyces TaxID=2593676 RepID=UPI00035DE983|nr:MULTISPECIES: DMT family transporter [unclassified Streptomyces]MYT29130.1 EamA family transporter [Streptomyces sp. SID8354]